jgi:hypothetical protein
MDNEQKSHIFLAASLAMGLIFLSYRGNIAGPLFELLSLMIEPNAAHSIDEQDLLIQNIAFYVCLGILLFMVFCFIEFCVLARLIRDNRHESVTKMSFLLVQGFISITEVS